MTLDRIYQDSKIDKEKIFLGILIVFSFLFIIRDVLQLNIPRSVFIFLAVIICLFFNNNHVYCFLAFIIPGANGISYTFISLIILLSLITKGINFNSTIIIIGLILSVIEILSFIYGPFNLFELVRFMGVFFVAFLYMGETKNNYDHAKILNYFYFGFIVAMINLFGQYIMHYSIIELFNLSIRFGNTEELFGYGKDAILLSYNANGLGTLCLLVIFTTLIMAKFQNKKIYYILTFFSILVGVMTQSRTFLLSFLMTIVVYFLFNIRSVRDFLRVILLGSIIGGICVFIFATVLSSYAESLLERFQTSDLFNGRIEIMQYYLLESLKYPLRFLFGVGMQDYQGKYLYEMSCHNAFQEIMITWGITGLFIIVYLFYYIIKNARMQNSKILLTQYLPFFIIIFVAQMGQGFTDYPAMLWLMIGYTAMLLKNDKEGKKID